MSSFASYMQANTMQDNAPDDAVGSNNYNTQGSNQNTGDVKKFRLKLSKRLHYTAVFSFISYLVLLISFASPYWLSSYKFTDSAFKRLGLWDFCFQNYQHPSYQYDIKFNGCHWIYSPVYTNIRDWLLPPWFMFVQAVTTIALCVSSIGLLNISIIFMHYLIQYQLIILCITFVCHLFTTMLLSFGLITFFLKAFNTSWIMYAEFNHLDWAFYFCLSSMAGNGAVSYLYYQEIRTLKEQLLKMKRLIVATSNGRSITGGDIDSLDAVYATRSVNSYNQSLGHDNQGSRATFGNKDASLSYPHFTQV